MRGKFFFTLNLIFNLGKGAQVESYSVSHAPPFLPRFFSKINDEDAAVAFLVNGQAVFLM